MKVKNISGRTQPIQVGLSCVTVANNDTFTVEDSPLAIADAKRLAAAGVIEIVEAPTSAEFAGTVDTPAHVVLTASANPADADTVTVNGVIFEFDSNAAYTAGRTPVTIGGTAAATLANLRTAINASATLSTAKIKANDQITAGLNEVAIIKQLGTTAISLSESSAALVATAVASADRPGLRQIVRTVAATGAEQTIYTGLSSIDTVIVQVRATGTNVLRAYDGAITTSGGLIFLDDNGVADIAAGDSIVLFVAGK